MKVLKLIIYILSLYILCIFVSSPITTLIRSVIGIFLVLLFPGYSILIILLYRNKNSIDIVEKLALSVGLSMAIIALLCFVLNYTPLGISFKTIFIPIVALTIISLTYFKYIYIKTSKNILSIRFFNVNKIDIIFFTVFYLALLSLKVSKYSSLAILSYFTCLLIMIITFLYNIFYTQKEKNILVVELLAPFLICVSTPLIIGWIPWRLSLHHAVYGQYIAEHGHKYCSNYLLIPVGFQSWPGSHMLLAAFIIMTGIDKALSYHIICILSGLIAVTFFYLTIKNISQNWKLAILSALFWSLFCNYIQFWSHAMHQGFSRAMTMVALYSLTKLSTIEDQNDREKVSFKIISVVSILAAIISHHLEPIIFLVMVGFLLLYKKLININENSFIKDIKPSFLLFGFILILSYWIYVVATAYFESWLDYFWENIRLLHQGVGPIITPTAAMEKYFYPKDFFPEWYIKLKRIYWILYTILGFIGIVYIITFLYKYKIKSIKKNDTVIKIGFTILWVMIILIVAGIISVTGGERFRVWRVLEYLTYPFSISIAIIVLKIFNCNYNIKYKIIKFLLLPLIIFILFLGIFTAYPPSIYTAKLTPLAVNTPDKYAAMYIDKHTDEDVIVFGDVRTLEAVLYWGHRGGYWGEKIDKVFRLNVSKQEIINNIVKAKYIILNIFNIKYKFYYRWGKFEAIPNDSIILHIDNCNNFGKIYDNSMCKIYIIYK